MYIHLVIKNVRLLRHADSIPHTHKHKGILIYTDFSCSNTINLIRTNTMILAIIKVKGGMVGYVYNCFNRDLTYGEKVYYNPISLKKENKS